MPAPHQASFLRQRRHDRVACDLIGVAFFPSGATSVRVIDISRGGAQIELPLHTDIYKAQNIYALRVSKVLQLRVSWRWSRDRRCGVEFLAPDLARCGLTQLIAELTGS